ncbi:hypothetical protein CEXT_51481 [Caerostris extrusa]|uniref:Uncharacterized protein n=1 Tax=Caerostris extrusa TaxID=172846 RepID=A0AAV4N577_CAEEX|nr:hypothetical protein CEXT_51481 [Caerostris extrusa]
MNGRPYLGTSDNFFLLTLLLENEPHPLMVLSFLSNDAEMFMPKPLEDRSLSRAWDVPSTGSCDWSTGRYWRDDFGVPGNRENVFLILSFFRLKKNRKGQRK